MRIVEFAFIAYPTTDLARSRLFYEDILGLSSTKTLTNDWAQRAFAGGGHQGVRAVLAAMLPNMALQLQH